MQIEEFLRTLVGEDPSANEGVITANEFEIICRVLGPIVDVHLLEADVSRAVAEIRRVAGMSYDGRYTRCRQKVGEIAALGGTVGKWSERWFWLVEDTSAAVFQEEHEELILLIQKLRLDDEDLSEELRRIAGELTRDEFWYKRRVFFLHVVLLAVLANSHQFEYGGGTEELGVLRVFGWSEPAVPSSRTPASEKAPSSRFVPHVLVVRHTLPFSA